MSGTQILSPTSEFEGTLVAYTPQFYIDNIQTAGGTPIMLPVGTAEDAKNMVQLIDTLVLTGGHDVDPDSYGENPHPKLNGIFPKRDTFDMALLEAALKKGIPVYGVCRGMQIINVYFGGSLYQDLESQYEGDLMLHVQSGALDVPVHYVTVREESRLIEMTGPNPKVNTLHHQGIKKIGNGLKAVAYSSDGMIEAFESVDSAQNILAVQWHPEILAAFDLASQAFFRDIVDTAKK
nr:gamma-glutamyl-gamma-aminobutyrate hydrolase family protein [Jeotgalibaca dankookensis]